MDAEGLDGDIRFCLVLPCEALSVPVMRRVLGGTLLGFGADEECVADILLAATEACTNVLKHGERCHEYEVSAKLRKDALLLEIANGTQARLETSGAGAAHHPIGTAPGRNGPANGTASNGMPGSGITANSPADNAAASNGMPGHGMLSAPTHNGADMDISQIRESGRGLTIMRACVDDLTLLGTPDRGTVVSMRKQINWAPTGHGRHANGRTASHAAAASAAPGTGALREAG
jgi:anti-sigma regulatory factor (Ser/Thr protein kinase)